MTPVPLATTAETDADSTSLFVATPSGFRPTPLTGGPWRPDAQHGGPPSALLARLVERLTEPDEVVARISVELVKPVPLTELTVESSRVRVSRRVGHGRASLLADGVVVATATALYLRTSELPAPDWEPDETTELPRESLAPDPPGWAAGEDGISFHRHGAEFRFVKGTFDAPGPAQTWVRLRQPLVDGEATSALCRVLAVADFGSGVSAIYRFEEGLGLINADLTVALHRPLIGEWVGLDSITRVGTHGVGLCTTRIFDERGQLGSAGQSLLGLVL